MIEKAKVVKADFYISKQGVSQVETLELEIESDAFQESKVILVKGRFLMDAVHQVITLKHIPVGAVEYGEYVAKLEGLPIRIDVIDGEIIALLHHLKKYVVFVNNGEVILG